MGNDSGHFSSAYSLESQEQTLTHYSSWAKSYDEEVSRDGQYAQPRRVAEALTALGVDKNSTILDVGCGTGLSGEALKEAGFTLIDGCDFSPEMLEKASAKSIYRNLFTADLNVGLPEIEDASCDVVTAVGVFSFGHVMPDACDDMLRVLKPNGIFVVALNEQFWDRGDLATKIEDLKSEKKIEEISREYGEHLPTHDVSGWVIVMKKLAE